MLRMELPGKWKRLRSENRITDVLKEVVGVKGEDAEDRKR